MKFMGDVGKKYDVERKYSRFFFEKLATDKEKVTIIFLKLY